MSLVLFHPECWWSGWSLILLGFLSGAAIGLGFQREEFLGGYTSFRRRIIRLGHIALVALGALNVLTAIAVPASATSQLAALLMIAGGIAMPTVCFLSGWRQRLAALFFIPVLCLVGAVILILFGGLP